MRELPNFTFCVFLTRVRPASAGGGGGKESSRELSALKPSSNRPPPRPESVKEPQSRSPPSSPGGPSCWSSSSSQLLTPVLRYQRPSEPVLSADCLCAFAAALHLWLGAAIFGDVADFATIVAGSGLFLDLVPQPGPGVIAFASSFAWLSPSSRSSAEAIDGRFSWGIFRLLVLVPRPQLPRQRMTDPSESEPWQPFARGCSRSP